MHTEEFWPAVVLDGRKLIMKSSRTMCVSICNAHAFDYQRCNWMGGWDNDNRLEFVEWIIQFSRISCYYWNLETSLWLRRHRKREIAFQRIQWGGCNISDRNAIRVRHNKFQHSQHVRYKRQIASAQRKLSCTSATFGWAGPERTKPSTYCPELCAQLARALLRKKNGCRTNRPSVSPHISCAASQISTSVRQPGFLCVHLVGVLVGMTTWNRIAPFVDGAMTDTRTGHAVSDVSRRVCRGHAEYLCLPLCNAASLPSMIRYGSLMPANPKHVRIAKNTTNTTIKSVLLPIASVYHTHSHTSTFSIAIYASEKASWPMPLTHT